MMTEAFDENGKLWRISWFKSQADAHQRKYYDDCGFPVTPCIYAYNSGVRSHFRYKTKSGGGVSDGISDEHRITQVRFARLFDRDKAFFVEYWDRDESGSLTKKDINLKDYYDSCVLEKKTGGRRPDILLTDSKNLAPPVFVEVCFSHLCDQQKIDEGHLIIEFRIEDYSDISNLVRSWGLKESFLRDRVPKVRFHNFRENRVQLPWNR